MISNTLFRGQITALCPINKQERRWRPNIKDEDDNFFIIELAVAGNAKYVITNNIGDFQNMQLKFPSIQILTPEQLLRG